MPLKVEISNVRTGGLSRPVVLQPGPHLHPFPDETPGRRKCTYYMGTAKSGASSTLLRSEDLLETFEVVARLERPGQSYSMDVTTPNGLQLRLKLTHL